MDDLKELQILGQTGATLKLWNFMDRVREARAYSDCFNKWRNNEWSASKKGGTVNRNNKICVKKVKLYAFNETWRQKRSELP